MKIMRFKGKDSYHALRQVKELLGDEAIILETKTVKDGNDNYVELVAAIDPPEESPGPYNIKQSPRSRPMGGRALKAKGHTPSVFGFIGLNGSGKTTSLLKMANALQEKGRGVSILNADSKKIGAEFALSRAAELLGCGFSNVRSPMELLGAIASMPGGEAILVDFPGGNLFEDEFVSELNKYFLAVPGMKAIGVAQASMDLLLLEMLFKTFKRLPVSTVVLTKVDELTDYVSRFEILADWGFDIVYVSNSPRVSEGLHEYILPPGMLATSAKNTKEMTCGKSS